MCRLFAQVGGDADSFAHAMSQLRPLSEVHAHGWGMAWYEDGRLRLERSAMKALQDPRFDSAVASASGDIILAHLRKATRGRQTVEAAHPFPLSDWAFMHNGTVEGDSAMRAALPKERVSQLKAGTDSEMMFHWMMDAIEREGDEVEGLRSGVSDLMPLVRRGSTAINFIMSRPGRLYAFRATFTRHDEYDLLYRERDGLAICSQALDGDWTRIGNGQLLMASADGFEIVQLVPGESVRASG